MNEERVAIVTGGSRGLGLQTARELSKRSFLVIIASRNPESLESAEKTLKGGGANIRSQVLDQGNQTSVLKFVDWVKSQFSEIDVLVNCAGVSLEGDDTDSTSTVLGAREEDVLETININTIGPWRLVRGLAPLFANNARIVNVSSGMGALTDMGDGYFGYRASKAALNVLTRTLAVELQRRGIMVNSVCPGWVRTDMGGPSAPRSLEQGAQGIVWAATLPPGGPTNGFFRDGKPIAW